MRAKYSPGSKSTSIREFKEMPLSSSLAISLACEFGPYKDKKVSIDPFDSILYVPAVVTWKRYLSLSFSSEMDALIGLAPIVIMGIKITLFVAGYLSLVDY